VGKDSWLEKSHEEKRTYVKRPPGEIRIFARADEWAAGKAEKSKIFALRSALRSPSGTVGEEVTKQNRRGVKKKSRSHEKRLARFQGELPYISYRVAPKLRRCGDLERGECVGPDSHQKARVLVTRSSRKKEIRSVRSGRQYGPPRPTSKEGTNTVASNKREKRRGISCASKT